MAIVERRTPEETRGCILSVAWDLFRQLGTRTTVADIADKSGMSSANVYRFFPSKQALSEAVCEGLLGEMLKVARRELDSPGTAAQRIAGMMLALHRLMRDQMTGEARAHEIVKVAVDEVWPPIVHYLHSCAAMLAEAIAEGQAAGEFGPGDPMLLGKRTMDACAGVLHPTLIAKCSDDDPDRDARGVVAFALRALANKNPPPVQLSLE
jgi:AcrR family transcriptional regulator